MRDVSYQADQGERSGKGEDADRSSLVRHLATEIPPPSGSDERIVPPFGPGEKGLSVVRESEKHLLQRYVTDVGRPVSSFTWEAVLSAKRFWYEQNGVSWPQSLTCTSLVEYHILSQEEWKAFVGEAGWRDTQILGDVDPSYNCRSYVFTDGLGGWIDGDVKHILEDNGFQRMKPEHARKEDIVIFRATFDTTTHHRNVLQTHEITMTHHVVNEIVHAAVVSRVGENGAHPPFC
ncbi:MAG: hypothetical protein J2P37_35845 [Ktedonobacteraceae bacterium]|nr:hypothetical protein [Ktedonobacteraceae bacterium]